MNAIAAPFKVLPWHAAFLLHGHAGEQRKMLGICGKRRNMGEIKVGSPLKSSNV
jgi:hypothetical protein